MKIKICGVFSRTILFVLCIITLNIISPRLWRGAGGEAFSQNNRLWATYYGGTGNDDYGWRVTTDTFGNVYMSGSTNSFNGIASGGFQNSYGAGTGITDAFLVKFDEAGNRLWATYYGGIESDQGWGIATDFLGNVYLSGLTGSATGIASGGFQNIFGGSADAFLVKFDPNGARLWATYYGGTGLDNGYAVATDILGNVYLAGETNSNSGIASGGFQNNFVGGVKDGFLVKFNASGNRLWATYYGGMGREEFLNVATDVTGNVYLSGQTDSPTGIASGGFQNAFAGGGIYGGDVFLAKFDASGSRLWATYYGGAGNDILGTTDFGVNIATDINSNVYLTGSTDSPTSIASGGFQNNYGGGNFDPFLVKFSASGSRIWATYYGGTSDWEMVSSVATDASGNIYLTGNTRSTSGIALGGFQNSLIGFENKFLVKFDASGNRQCATYFGQVFERNGNVAVDSDANVYVSGTGRSTSGIAYGGFQNTYGGGVEDAFLVKFSSCSNLVTNAISTNISCNGQCTGTGTATIIGGTPPFTYSWSNGATTATITGLCMGTYTVTITDFSSASTTTTITITEPAVLSATTTVNNPMCYGSAGNATANAMGGTSSYTYFWNNGKTNQTVSGLSEGTYTVIITDNNGCQTFSAATILVPTAITSTISTVPATCNNANGSATIVASGGAGNYIYSWSTGQTSVSVIGLSSAIYTITVTDTNFCTITSTITITSSNTPDINVQDSSSSSCKQANDGYISVLVNNGTPPYYYFWSPVANTNSSISNLSAGTYTVIITDANNCSQNLSISLTEPPLLTLGNTITNTTCGEDNGQAIASANGGTSSYNYLWSNGATTSQLTHLAAGSYTVTTTDSNGCTTTQSISILSSSIATTDAGTDTTITEGSSVQLNSTTGGITYSWTPIAGLSCTSCPSPIATPQETTKYYLTISDASGCTAIDSVQVTVTEIICGELFIPTAFSPNDDGENDKLVIKAICTNTFLITIYNRWGEKMYESIDPNQHWDGTLQGQQLDVGVFVFRLEATFVNGDQVIKKGNISLIK